MKDNINVVDSTRVQPFMIPGESQWRRHLALAELTIDLKGQNESVKAEVDYRGKDKRTFVPLGVIPMGSKGNLHIFSPKFTKGEFQNSWEETDVVITNSMSPEGKFPIPFLVIARQINYYQDESVRDVEFPLFGSAEYLDEMGKTRDPIVIGETGMYWRIGTIIDQQHIRTIGNDDDSLSFIPSDCKCVQQTFGSHNDVVTIPDKVITFDHEGNGRSISSLYTMQRAFRLFPLSPKTELIIGSHFGSNVTIKYQDQIQPNKVKMRGLVYS